MVDSQTSTVFSTLFIYGSIGIIFTLIFEGCRSQTIVYFPRCRDVTRGKLISPEAYPFAWIVATYSQSEEETLALVGTDGIVLLRLLKFCARFCLICCILGFTVLIPVYTTSPFNPDNPGIRRWSMGNVPESDDRLWTSWLLTYVFSFSFLVLLHFEFKYFVKLRQKYFQGDFQSLSQSLYSVQVEGIPRELKSSRKLKAFFEKLFPGLIHSASLTLDVPILQRKCNDRACTAKDLEIAIANSEASGNKLARFSASGKPSLCGGSKGDLLLFLHSEISRQDDEIYHLRKSVNDFEVAIESQSYDEISASGLQAEVLQLLKSLPRTRKPQYSKGSSSLSPSSHVDSNSNVNTDYSVTEGLEAIRPPTNPPAPLPSTTGFVTFTSKCAQTAACQLAILDSRYPAFRACQAPHRDDLIWSNVPTSSHWTNFASQVTMVVFSTGIIFWAAIISFIATISQLAFLAQYLPFINDLDPLSYSVLAGVLPVLILSIFLGLLPTIFKAVALYFEKRKTVSEVQRMVFSWYFTYVLANVYLTLLSGSVASAIVSIISDPGSIIPMLGAALPSVSIFFINYILAQVLMGIPLQQLRLGSLIVWNLVYVTCTNEKKLTRRQLLEGPLSDQTVDYGATLPAIMYIILIVQLYWVITPLIPVVGLAYFAGLYIVFKYQLIYVYVPKYESGGLFWFDIYYRLNLGLIISSITMIGYLGIKKGAAQAVLLAPLPLLIIVAWRYTDSQFASVSRNLAFVDAADADRIQETNTLIPDSFSDNYYRQSCLTAKLGAIYPYREGDIPLLNSKGEVNAIYYRSSAYSLDGSTADADAAELLAESFLATAITAV